jgi:putative Ca2+/H+ antiporter (TMEM165/GDT1 family)
MSIVSGVGFWEGGLAACIMILSSEMGDKTFLIEVILSSKGSRLAVFCGTMIAMTLMTVLGAYIGAVFVLFIDPYYISIASACIFIAFAIVSFFDVCFPRDDFENQNNLIKDGASWKETFYKALTLVLLAEWGDRSQIGTMALASKNSIGSVILGAVVGHSICSMTAVLAGRCCASYISERVMSGIACVLFAWFAYLVILNL